ncbi:putative UDP-glucuronate 5'-epimerase [Pseudescherichia vulneris NBRC 102420]|uniref:Putative UDP-glucuronate 5'-epimerase n=1 Tax=Pseudescherichia vulneris NBRC 102420 TaxID=1115515 RepID=A0A090VQY8_PSEVU|nr:putative UDP-glucuronate 5'-epimerase [Pseudescherichia vulneris NBRC 102420]STQ60599.1 UDP-glucose 4-epimerase [Pseudescherichia vulneris]
MKFLVTRAAGFIGFHASERLLAAGHQVVRIDNLNDYCDVSFKQARLSLLASKNITFHKLALADHEGKEMLFADEKFNRVTHLAVHKRMHYPLENPHAYANANLIGHFNVLEDCCHNKFQYLSDVIPHTDAEWAVETGTPATSSAPYHVYNISNSSLPKLVDYITALKEVLGTTAEKICCRSS